jgi:arabinofuranan 3-O-arabinosyltransferase
MVSPARSPFRTPTGLFAGCLTALCLGVAGWLFVRYPGLLVSGVANPDPKGHIDFQTFWRSTSALLHGRDLYNTGSVLPNLNPPFLSLLLAPFGLLPVMPSYWLFTALSVLLATGRVLGRARELQLGRAATVFAVVTLLASSPLHGTLLLGQIYVLLMAGLAAAWLAGRRDRPGLAALLVALVVALKPSLAPLLLVPLCWRGHPARWSSVAIGMSAAAGFSLAGVLIAGPASAVDWLRLATGTPAPEFDANASLPGVLARLSAPAAYGWVVTVVVVLGTLWWVRRPHIVGRTPPGVVGSADTVWFAVAAGCLLASPIAWLNYWVVLWPGVLVLLRAGRWWAAVPLLVASIIPVAWGNLWQAAPHAPAALAGRSLYCVVLLGFWFALSAYSFGSKTAVADAERGWERTADPAPSDAERADVFSSAGRSD